MASSASGAAGPFNPKAPLKKTYRWQSKRGGRVGFGRKPESTVQHIEKLQRRRVELLEVDVASSPALLTEWQALIVHLDASTRLNVEEQAAAAQRNAAPAQPKPASRNRAFSIDFEEEGGVVDDELPGAPREPGIGTKAAKVLKMPINKLRWLTRPGTKAVYVSPNERASPSDRASLSGWSAHDGACADAGEAVRLEANGGGARRPNALPGDSDDEASHGQRLPTNADEMIRTGLSQMREKLQRMVDQGKFGADEAMQIWIDAVEAAAGESQRGAESGPAADAAPSPEEAAPAMATAIPGSRQYLPGASSSQRVPPATESKLQDTNVNTDPTESPDQDGDGDVRAGPYGAML